jgi:hypothetical protein
MQAAYLTFLKSMLDYGPDTGQFRWKVERPKHGGMTRVGDIAGGDKEGYIVITIDGRRWRAHILAWLFMTGEMPPEDIDHIDRDRSNNCWINLRLATRSVNNHNSTPSIVNSSGVKGVSWNEAKQRWHARIQVEDRLILLGDFAVFEDAVTARQQAELQHLGEVSPIDETLSSMSSKRVGKQADRSANVRASWSDPTLRAEQSQRARKHLADPKNYNQRVTQLASIADLGSEAARKAVKGSIWITNGAANRRVQKETTFPEGWRKGRA